MRSFRQVIRLVMMLAGVLAGMLVTFVALFLRLMTFPTRQRLWCFPTDLGMEFEDVTFPARDGVRLSGWFIPTGNSREKSAPTVVMVHGWPWNRLGTSAASPLTDLPGSKSLDLSRLALSFNKAGFHVLMFDLRNHGRSAGAPPVTFGWRESRDVLGAIDYVASREDVDDYRVSAIGFSAGANALLFALPQVETLRAAVAVQPLSVGIFAARYSRSMLGPLGNVVVAATNFAYQLVGGPQFSSISPASVLGEGIETPILFVQGKGDQWGSLQDVVEMVSASPSAVEPMYVDTKDRFEGYQYLIDNPESMLSFLQRYTV